MYKNLKKEIERLKIPYKDIFNNCSMSEYFEDIKYFSRRLNGNGLFEKEDIEDIYRYLKKRGYQSSKNKKEDIDYLFKYSKLEKESSKITPLSKLIKKRMAELKLSNKDVVNQFDKFGVPITITTLNNWKNEGVKILRDDNIDSLSKILKIPKSALYRSKNGDDSYINYILDKENRDIFISKNLRTSIDYRDDEIPIMRFSIADRTLKDIQSYMIKFSKNYSKEDIDSVINENRNKYLEIIDNHNEDILERIERDLEELGNEIVIIETNDSKSKKGRKKDGKK